MAKRQLVMSLRKNFDSFTPQQKLRDAQEEFAQAVYRFRAAEEANAQFVKRLQRYLLVTASCSEADAIKRS